MRVDVGEEGVGTRDVGGSRGRRVVGKRKKYLRFSRLVVTNRGKDDTRCMG